MNFRGLKDAFRLYFEFEGIYHDESCNEQRLILIAREGVDVFSLAT